MRGLYRRKGGEVWHLRVTLPNGKRVSRCTLESDKRRAVQAAHAIRAELLDAARDPTARHKGRPVREVVDEFHDTALGGGTPKHARMQRDRLTRAFKSCRFDTLGDIELAPLERYLARLRDGDRRVCSERGNDRARGFGVTSRNHVIGAARHFMRWCIERGYLGHDPLAALRRERCRPADRKVQRRALTPDEIGRLLATTEADWRTRYRLSGWERATLYEFGLATGVRAGEAARLTWGDLRLDGERPEVVVRPELSKSGRGRSIPLTASLACRLATYRAQRDAEGCPVALDAPALPTPRHPSDFARMLKRDLERAGLAYETCDGTCDFHALRVTFATSLAMNNVAPKVAQRWLGHSSITMTLDVYARYLDDGSGAGEIERATAGWADPKPALRVAS